MDPIGPWWRTPRWPDCCAAARTTWALGGYRKGLRPCDNPRGSCLGDFVLGNYLRRFKAVRVLWTDSTTIKVCRIGVIVPVDNYCDVVIFDVNIAAIFSVKLFNVVHCLASCCLGTAGGLRPRGSVVAYLISHITLSILWPRALSAHMMVDSVRSRQWLSCSGSMSLGSSNL